MSPRPSEFPPLKKLALQLLARGPMTFTPEVGWRSPFSRVAFNRHTISFAAGRGWCVLDGDTAQGTLDGAMKLRELEEGTAAA